MELIYTQIAKKAEFLVKLEAPAVAFKQQSTDIDSKIYKKPSYMADETAPSHEEEKDVDWKQSMQVWHNQLYDFGKIRSPNEAAQQVKEAGTISVLAML